MKKQITLLLLIMLMGSSSILSQSLQNTTWTVYDTNNNFFLYFHFDADIVSYSNDNITYNNVATYQETGNDFTTIDLPETRRCIGDIGRYTFLLQNDILKFTLVSDDCLSRPTTFTSYQWVRWQLGVQEINLVPSINMYPNPTSDLLTISFEEEINITVANLQGQIIKRIKTDTKTISLSGLATGIYIVSVFNKDNKLLTTRKIVLEK